MVSLLKLLSEIDSKINGSRPWDVLINPFKLPALQHRVEKEGVYGLSDSYVEGVWNCRALDELFYRIVDRNVGTAFSDHPTEIKRFEEERDGNLQAGSESKENIRKHYDAIPEEVFLATLDKMVTYSCGYWRNGAQNLDEAQEAKLDLVCRKLRLKPGQRVLDIGSGWGSFVRFAAEHYGVKATGITLSENQLEYVNRTKGDLPIEVRLMDYKDLKGSGEKFDAIASIGMFEHVGHKNFRIYMEAAHGVLKEGGLFLLHNFGSIHDTPNTKQPETRWVEKHIFPGMELPSQRQIVAASEGLFNVQDVHEFGTDYHPTLMAWATNFERAWSTLQPKLVEKYGSQFEGDRFPRFWNHYLKICAGGFKAGSKFQLWHHAFSKGELEETYQLAR